MTIHLKISILFAAVLLLTLFALCWLLGDMPADHYLNVAVFVSGWACGWLLGTFVAPYDPGESTLFNKLSRAISAFVSGYLVAKIDGLTRAIADPAFILHPLPGFRLMTFVSVAVIVTIVVFFARRYSNWHHPGASVL
jgi:hypothetical protein